MSTIHQNILNEILAFNLFKSYTHTYYTMTLVSRPIVSLWASRKQVDEISNSVDEDSTMDGSSRLQLLARA